MIEADNRFNLPGKTKPYIMAHRGNRAICPENTMASFKQALEDGADILETDIHLTADGVFVCIHDDTVDRTTNGTGKVSEMTLEELKMLSAGYGFEGFEHERVPTLTEVAESLPEDAALALELKIDDFIEDEQVCRGLVAELDRAGVRERTVLISFNLERTLAVHRVASDMTMGFITLSKLRPREDANFMGPFWPIMFINPFYTRKAHRYNQWVCPLDTAAEKRMWYYRLMKCDVVMSDDPAALFAAKNKHRK
jgi:glycerophosphoryl diester phosphodiesterase